jgi:hypothetical protein
MTKSIYMEQKRVQELKKAYEKGIIDIQEFENEVETALEESSRKNNNLNTSKNLGEQLWMSESTSEKPDPAEFIPVTDKMHLPVKPVGGMWTSTYTPNEEFDSDWIRWCSTEGFYAGRHKWLMKPKNNLEVLVVDNKEDLKSIAEAYEKDTYKGTDTSLLSEIVLDFKKIAEDFDAMRLTKNGQWETRLTDRGEPSLYGWDSESVLHFRWNWKVFEYVGCSDIKPTLENT